jgi:hypothetical protein
MSRAINQDILLDTAKGEPILNSQETIINHPLAAQALVDRIVHPSLLRSNPNPRYNCHGLTFGSRRTAILEDSEVTHILQQDGYRVIPLSAVLPGDIAIYYAEDGTIDHSAVVVSKPDAITHIPFVYGKWGVIGPEVFHLATEGPDYAISDIRYYRIYI